MSKKSAKGSKQHNPLLVKVEVGKIRSTVYDLPSEDHIYGIAVVRDPLECAATAITNWNVKANSKEQVPALDYITMNRNSARFGLNTPKQIRQYRKEHPVRRKEGENQSMYKTEGVGNGSFTRAKASLPSDKNVQFTYGKPTRPSTPVALLMTSQFQQEWKAKREQVALEEEKAEKEREAKMKKQHKAILNRGINAANHPKNKPKNIVDKDIASLFKMSKFKKVPANVNSHRLPVAHAVPSAVPVAVA